MEINNNNCVFSQKLTEFFEENIKLSFVSKISVIIIDKNDKLFEFRRNYFIKRIKNSLIALSHNESKIKSLIKDSFVEELSYKKIIDIKNSLWHSIARTIEGKIYCWGGFDLETSKPEFNQLLINQHVIDMCCGSGHILLLTITGVVYAWGYNDFGQIGNGKSGSFEYQLTPFELKAFNGEKVERISCGFDHSLALTENGQVYSWGQNISGQLGIGNRNDSHSPKLVNLNKQVIIKKISCGYRHSILLSREGDIYVCGWNGSGEPNTSYRMTKSFPKKLSHSEKFDDIASHFYYSVSAAISLNSSTYIWGDCDKRVITEPEETNQSFNDIFEHQFEITFKPIEGKIIRFNDDFIQNGKYEKDFTDKERIGKGSYGEVFKVIKKGDNNNYALKTIKFTVNFKDNLMKELETSPIISELSNENIVKYLDLWLENDLIQENDVETSIRKFILNIQMELCDESLTVIIDEIKTNFFNVYPDETLSILGFYICSEIFIEILEGVNYLHHHDPQIIHRDLNPWNILLKIEKKSVRFVKIADFGLATIHEYLDQSHTRDRGHVKYIAPEVEASTKYDTRADIFSLGNVLEKLFFIDINRDYEINPAKQITVIINKYIAISDLCDRMTRKRANQRPANIEEILKEKHLWSLNVNEFDSNVEFKKFLISNESNKAFVLKLLKKRLDLENKS